jgi:hypothetical protein
VNADFLDAHRRHLRDADYLFSASYLANADHLYGMAAECGLKRLMMAFGMQTDNNTGAPVDRKNDFIHAEKIWARYESYRSGHVQGVQYDLPPLNPFDDWKAEQRYAHEQCFDNARIEPHRAAAHRIRALVKNAEMAGLI